MDILVWGGELIGGFIGSWISFLIIGGILGLFGIWKLGKIPATCIIVFLSMIIWSLPFAEDRSGNIYNTANPLVLFVSVGLGIVAYVLVNVRNKNIKN